MTFEDQGKTGGDELDPEGRYSALTGSLGSAFRSQADGVEPSPDAYTKLANAVVNDQDRRTRGARSIGWLRPIAAAAAVVATVGIGGALLANQGSQSVDTAPGDDQSALQAEPVPGAEDDAEPDVETESITEPVPDTTTSTQPPASDGGEVAAGQPAGAVGTTLPGYGPIRATRLDAAQAFMDLLRLDDGYPAIVDDQVVVFSFGPDQSTGGDDIIVATLAMANLEDGYAVREAYAESIFIDAVFGGSGDAATMRIEGSGHGFESVLDVRVMGAFDSRVIGAGFVNAGNFGQAEPFEAEVEVFGHEHGWVVVSSSGGADGVIDPFAAKAVSFESVADPVEYAVIGVSEDDPDGGLLVRSGPGTGNDVLAVLPGGTGGIVRAQAYPVQVGTSTWWSIVTPDDVVGWINSRYLASNEALTAEELSALASRVQFFTSYPPSLPLAARLPVAIGSIVEPITVQGEELASFDGWNAQRTFPMPEAYGEPEQTPLIALTMAEGWVDVEPELAASYTYESNRRAAETYFAGLSYVVFSQENPTGPWARTFVYAERTPAGPEIVGIVVEVQEP